MSIPDQRFIAVIERLNQISDEEWKSLIKKCKDHINIRLKHKRATGAHSEKNLGMSAFDFYFGTAIEKIYSGVWDWKFEKFTILEQFIRIIDSMISEVVRKYKIHQKKAFALTYDDIEHSFYDLADPNQCEPLEDDQEYYKNMISTIEEAIDGNDDLEKYFLCIMEGMSVDGIAKELDWPKRKVYKTTEKLQRKVRSHMKSKRYAAGNEQ